MSDIFDAYKAIENDRKQRGWERHTRIADEYPEAKELAEKHGMTLKQFNGGIHYQLSKPDLWILNLYPNNRRIYSDKNKPGPYIGELDRWTLTAIIERVVECEGGAR